MRELLPIAGSLGVAIVGGAISGLFLLAAGRSQSRAAAKSDLAAAVYAYSAAVERLVLELREMPVVNDRVGAATERALARIPRINWLVAMVSKRVLLRPTMRALDEYLAAYTRLSLAAPLELLQAASPFNELMASTDKSHRRDDREWLEARAACLHVARHHLGVDDGQRTRTVTSSDG